MQLAAFIMNQ